MTDRPTVETTPAALRRAAQTWPEREAVADVQPGHDTRWTWTDLLEQVRVFAAGLLARNVAIVQEPKMGWDELISGYMLRGLALRIGDGSWRPNGASAVAEDGS